MLVELFELPPFNTRNKIWLGEIFEIAVKRFDGVLNENIFPVFIVQDDANLDLAQRSIRYKLFEFLDSIERKFGIIHVADENYDHNLELYQLDGCLFVFREYFRPVGGMTSFVAHYLKSFFLPAYPNVSHNHFRALGSRVKRRFIGQYSVHSFLQRQFLPRLHCPAKVFHLPIGYTDTSVIDSSQVTSCADISARKYRWSFCGEGYKKDREKMMLAMSVIKPHFIHRYDHHHQNVLLGADYADIMRNTIFVPCPIGNINLETYRLFEALEANAIPLILSRYAYHPYDYYRFLVGEHPIPAFKTWTCAANFTGSVNESDVLELSHRIRQWYTHYKISLRESVRNFMFKHVSICNENERIKFYKYTDEIVTM